MPLPLWLITFMFSGVILSFELAISSFGNEKIGDNILCTATKLGKSGSSDRVTLRANCAVPRGGSKNVTTDNAKVILNFANRNERLLKCAVYESGRADCKPARAVRNRQN